MVENLLFLLLESKSWFFDSFKNCYFQNFISKIDFSILCNNCFEFIYRALTQYCHFVPKSRVGTIPFFVCLKTPIFWKCLKLVLNLILFAFLTQFSLYIQVRYLLLGLRTKNSILRTKINLRNLFFLSWLKIQKTCIYQKTRKVAFM